MLSRHTPPTLAAALEQHEVALALLFEADGRAEPGEPGADNHDPMVLRCDVAHPGPPVAAGGRRRYQLQGSAGEQHGGEQLGGGALEIAQAPPTLDGDEDQLVDGADDGGRHHRRERPDLGVLAATGVDQAAEQLGELLVHLAAQLEALGPAAWISTRNVWVSAGFSSSRCR